MTLEELYEYLEIYVANGYISRNQHMTLDELYEYLGIYVAKGYGKLNIQFGECGKINSIQLSADKQTMFLKESLSQPVFEAGLYDVGEQELYVCKQATGEEGPGVHKGDFVFERIDHTGIACTLCRPQKQRFTGQVVPYANYRRGMHYEKRS